MNVIASTPGPNSGSGQENPEKMKVCMALAMHTFIFSGTLGRGCNRVRRYVVDKSAW